MYLIRKEEKSFGPFSENEIRELYQSGGISPATEVAQDGTNEWKPLIQWNLIKDNPRQSQAFSPSIETQTATPGFSPMDQYPYAIQDTTLRPQGNQPFVNEPIPTGILLIGILYSLGAFGCILLAIFALIFQFHSKPVDGISPSALTLTFISGFSAALGLIALFFALINGLIAYGIFTLRNWARIIVMVLSGLGIVSQLQSCIILNEKNAVAVITGSLLAVILSGAIIYYLNLERIKYRFN